MKPAETPAKPIDGAVRALPPVRSGHRGRGIAKWALLVTGFVVCPCHYPITLPILAALFSGTTAGVILSEQTGLLFLVGTIYFAAAIAIGLALYARRSPQGEHNESNQPDGLRLENHGQ